MNAEAAQHDARRQFGNATLAKERAHEVNIVVSIETIGRDLRYALRQYRKAPGFTLTAILVLALGVAASVSIFTFVNAALLKPLPFQDPNRDHGGTGEPLFICLDDTAGKILVMRGVVSHYI
jgi:macrolide transport system ATP-binding/permease protein